MIRWLPRRIVWGRTPPSAERWRAGDLAECIRHINWGNPFGDLVNGPAMGERHVVRAVGRSGFDGRQLLTFARFAPRCFDAACFRKIVPQADAPVAADRAFLDRLIRVPAPQEEA